MCRSRYFFNFPPHPAGWKLPWYLVWRSQSASSSLCLLRFIASTSYGWWAKPSTSPQAFMRHLKRIGFVCPTFSHKQAPKCLWVRLKRNILGSTHLYTHFLNVLECAHVSQHGLCKTPFRCGCCMAAYLRPFFGRLLFTLVDTVDMRSFHLFLT